MRDNIEDDDGYAILLGCPWVGVSKRDGAETVDAAHNEEEVDELIGLMADCVIIADKEGCVGGRRGCAGCALFWLWFGSQLMHLNGRNASDLLITLVR